MENVMMTIFTPTYNRAYLLARVYDSIKEQNYKEVRWVIMDDGSTDNTRNLVKEWQVENLCDIEYHYQKNHGRFEAYNNARQYFVGELVVPVDSDDYLVKGALWKISEVWKKLDEGYSGIMAHFLNENNEIVGTRFPKGITKEKSYVLYDKYHMDGDKVMVYRTDLMKKVQYPVFDGERFGGDSIIFNKINDWYPMYLYDEPLEYLGQVGNDRISKNLKEYHLSSPNGMREHYREEVRVVTFRNPFRLLKKCIGYISYSIMTNTSLRECIEGTTKKFLVILCIPFGWCYYCYLIRLKQKIFEDIR